MISWAVRKAFELKKDRNWDKLYWAIDFHDTLFKGQYNPDQDIVLYPWSIQVLTQLNKMGHVLIAYTSTPTEKVFEICDFLFKVHGIKFHYVNENPEYVASGNYADFSTKFYYNILLDDKAGFDPDLDWSNIKTELIRLGVWESI